MNLSQKFLVVLFAIFLATLFVSSQNSAYAVTACGSNGAPPWYCLDCQTCGATVGTCNNKIQTGSCQCTGYQTIYDVCEEEYGVQACTPPTSCNPAPTAVPTLPVGSTTCSFNDWGGCNNGTQRCVTQQNQPECPGGGCGCYSNFCSDGSTQSCGGSGDPSATPTSGGTGGGGISMIDWITYFWAKVRRVDLPQIIGADVNGDGQINLADFESLRLRQNPS